MKLAKPVEQMSQEEFQKTERWLYFARMSEALAMKCHKEATVMSPDLKKIPSDGIWGKRERPTLEKRHGPDNTVDLVRVFVNRAMK